MENKTATNINVNKLIRVLSEELILNKLNVLIFQNKNINHIYEKAIKLCLIYLVYLKFLMVDFPYDTNIKSSIKKVVSGLITSFLLIYENYILSPQVSKFLLKHGDIHEKFSKASKIYNISKSVRYQDVMVYALKNLETISTQIKIFSM